MGKAIPGGGSGLVSKEGKKNTLQVRKPFWQKHILCGQHVVGEYRKIGGQALSEREGHVTPLLPQGTLRNFEQEVSSSEL